MIDLIFNSDGIFIFDVDDWATLRKQHRIVGQIIGNTGALPSLPVQLLPEEVLLLVEKGIACIKRVTNYNNDPELAKQKYEEFENILLEKQIAEYKKGRRVQLEKFIDKIVEKRRESNDMRSAEEILNEELEKSININKDNMIWPIFLRPIDPAFVSTMDVSIDEVYSQTTKIRRLVFRDLWEKGYYVTEGGKFGGDYLAYVGDPICFHAIFIVKCVESEQNISPSEIVAFGRLGTSVRKRAVLASVLDDEVSYVTINWIDS